MTLIEVGRPVSIMLLLPKLKGVTLIIFQVLLLINHHHAVFVHREQVHFSIFLLYEHHTLFGTIFICPKKCINYISLFCYCIKIIQFLVQFSFPAYQNITYNISLFYYCINKNIIHFLVQVSFPGLHMT